MRKFELAMVALMLSPLFLLLGIIITGAPSSYGMWLIALPVAAIAGLIFKK